MINGKTRICGLIGNPVEHTLSPVIHNLLAEKYSQNLVYVPFLVEDAFLEQAISGAKALNVLGCNVTVPYKSNVIPWLKELDPLAKKIGAVNTLVLTKDGYKGYNTDMPGLLRAMKSDGVAVTGKEVIILGAGGVARAVAYLMAQEQAKKIWVVNRTIEKAKEIEKEIKEQYLHCEIEAITYDNLTCLEGNGYLAIQATSVGLYPNDDEVIVEAKSFYQKLEVAYDLIFNPKETMFMKLAKKEGVRAYNGLKMLLYQGIIAYELWTKTTVCETIIDEVYMRLREEI